MPANLWKSLTVRFMALGHSLRDAECIAAVILIDCLVMYTIMGYRFSDAERGRLPAHSSPEASSMIGAGLCGSVPEGVDRDRILLQCQPNPVEPNSRKERSGVACTQGSSPVVMQDTAMMCW
jgi:hypothetical protein